MCLTNGEHYTKKSVMPKSQKDRRMWAHLRNSPPSLLMIGNNYLKQLAVGVRPRTSLEVVFTSCSGCFQSQNAWVKNADAPAYVRDAILCKTRYASIMGT